MNKAGWMTGADFAVWLEEMIHERDWKPADLAHAARMNTGTLSNILNGTRGVGPKVCRNIARALKLPEDIVFRKAGLQSARRDGDEVKDEILYYYDRMTAEQREHYRVIGRALAEAAVKHEADDVEKDRARGGAPAPA